jgi:hypothetical protein
MTSEEIERVACDGILHCDHTEASVEASGQITPMPAGFRSSPLAFSIVLHYDSK